MSITELAQKYDSLKEVAKRSFEKETVVVSFPRFSPDTGKQVSEIIETGSINDAKLEIERLQEQIKLIKQLVKQKENIKRIK